MNFSLAGARKSRCQFGVSGSQATVKSHGWILVHSQDAARCSRHALALPGSTALPDVLLLCCTPSCSELREGELCAFRGTVMRVAVLRDPLQAS